MPNPCQMRFPEWIAAYVPDELELSRLLKCNQGFQARFGSRLTTQAPPV